MLTNNNKYYLKTYSLQLIILIYNLPLKYCSHGAFKNNYQKAFVNETRFVNLHVLHV